ncbi:flagellar biosynthesis protein FlhA [Hydrogenoanaerobacterium sp.]|uniref:flagellar biosynthesis protein FlhA n=1 Tax=Hydrogenoanaerobacterium sp. TaxID=2953763 RepID=UPI00289B4016|nr:flagellar biosynthesis protein FlhA [Hydrogenoanaerobacterium sp.]
MKKFNFIVSVFVVTIIFLIIVPLPPFWLDLMFILNLTLSFVILITSMYIRESLEFSIFPSILLITTLFRLALNISSTRLILLEDGNAGQVVKTFGEFVIRGNAVVGLIIFLIIVLVQFIVITKGSERVAEVAARFTLDAMPGKQMAIDADLNSGLIDEQQARERRLKIQREADFFGSMDGASKFVKGDAIMSIIVTFINLIGGIIMGFINNVGSFSEIMQIYTTATVGDGLISQLPALLISVATGMIVTRSASESNLNEEVSKQFLSQPKVLIMAGVAVGALCLIPGFPRLQILTVSIGLISLGIVLQRKGSPVVQPEQGLLPETEVTSEASYYKNIDNVYGLLTVEQIEMEFGYSLIPLVDESNGGSFIDRVVMFRKQLALEMGMVIPSVRLKDSGQLNPNQYSIKFKGEEVARGDILVDHYLALSPGEIAEEIEGIDTIEPAFNIPAKWISDDKKIKAELAGYTLIDPTSVIITHLSEVIKMHLHELLNRQEVNNLVSNLRKSNETIVNDTIPEIISIGNLQKVLANLLREGVPIRDMETIVETLGDYGAQIKDTDMLTEYVRQSLKRTISHKFSEAGQMKVVSLDAQIENMIMGSVKKMDSGSYLALDPQAIQNIVSATTTEINKIKDLVQAPTIITSPVVRIYFKKLIDQFYPNIVVLSFSEIDNNIQIQALGNISIV